MTGHCQIISRILQDDDGMHIGEEECGKLAIVKDQYWMCREHAVEMAKSGDCINPDLETIILILES